jgi:hypothetical protein
MHEFFSRERDQLTPSEFPYDMEKPKSKSKIALGRHGLCEAPQVPVDTEQLVPSNIACY